MGEKAGADTGRERQEAGELDVRVANAKGGPMFLSNAANLKSNMLLPLATADVTGDACVCLVSKLHLRTPPARLL